MGSVEQIQLINSAGDAVVNPASEATTDSVKTAVELIDDAIFADDAAFTLASSKTMVAGAIRDDVLSALTAVEGDVVPLRVSSTGALHVTGSSGVTEFNEDDTHQSGDAGIQMLVVRNDTIGALAGSNGDYAPLQVNASGALYVDVTNTELGTTFDYAEDSAHLGGDTGAFVLGVRNDTLEALAGTDGDYAPFQMNASGALYTEISSALPAGTNAIGKLAANSGVDIGDVDVLSSALPTGASTLAEQQSQTTHLATIAGDTTSLDGKDFATQTTLASIKDTDGIKKIQGEVDTGNSTTTPLNAAAVFTGAWKDITDFAGVSILLRSDQDSATDGATVELSIDGVTVDRTLTATYLAAAGGLYFNIPREAQFYRLKYTNGGTNQTVFRLESILHSSPVGVASAPLTASLKDTNTTALTRAVVAGKRDDGTYDNVALDNASRLKVKTIPDLASQGVGRTQVEFASVNNTADVTAYTVTASKDLVLKVLQVSVLNTSTVAQGRLTIRDGGSSGTIKHEFNLPTAVAGTQSPHLHLAIAIPEEGWSFGTDIFMDVQGGTLTFSVSGIGYEE